MGPFQSKAKGNPLLCFEKPLAVQACLLISIPVVGFPKTATCLVSPHARPAWFPRTLKHGMLYPTWFPTGKPFEATGRKASEHQHHVKPCEDRQQSPWRTCRLERLGSLRLPRVESFACFEVPGTHALVTRIRESMKKEET